MNMVHPPCGYCGSFVSLRAYVMLGVQLPTCVSSPSRSTSVQSEFSPTVPLYVLCCFWDGQTHLKLRTVLRTEALCLFPVHVAVSIFLLLACLVILLSAPPVLLVSAPVSGLPVSTMICWKGVSFPLGMAIDLISLLWASLHSSHRRWPPLRIHYGPRTRHGKLVRSRRHLWWTSLLLILLRHISPLRTVLLWALHLVRVCAHFGRCFRFHLLPHFRAALLLTLLPRLQRSVHCARAHVLLVV